MARVRSRRIRRGFNSHLRVLFLASIAVISFSGLIARLWTVQVRDGQYYAAQLPARSEIKVRIPPVRGEIRDRNGLVLAENTASYDIELYLPDIVRYYRERFGHVPAIAYKGRVHGMAKLLDEPDIVQIVDTTIVPRLLELRLPSSYDQDALRRHFRTDAEVPFVFVENANLATVSQFSEHSLGLPGIRVAAHPIRHYPYGAFASHVLGYVGEPQDVSQLSDSRQFAFYEPNVEGKAQLEQSLDNYLRGTPGARLMERNVEGVIDKTLGTQPPHSGDTVFLTIDARIQFLAEEAMRSVARGAAVVVDPRNGEVLAMVSVPSFDPNVFVPSIASSDWQGLVKDPTKPLINRAVDALPPGSTFKLVTALAGVRQGLAKTAFTCNGGVQYGDHYFKCWNSHGHGRLGLSDALKVSCNAFFYQYGNAAGIDSINAVGTLLGFGQLPHVGLTGEESGILPGPEWLKMHSPTERWSAAQTANVSIGQGYDLVSPLQLVMAYSALANGGTVYEPHFVTRIADSNGSLAPDASTGPKLRGRLADIGIKSADLEPIRTGLWKVVNEDGGTAGRARLPGGIVAGKTGTAQAQLHGKQDTIAWFVGFAPYDNPRYAVCVMVQGGAHGGSVAAPIAAHILQETLAMDAGSYQPSLVALPPAQHGDPFRMIQAVNFADLGKQGASVNGTASTPASGSHEHKSRVAVSRAKNVAPDRIPRPAPPTATRAPHRNIFQWLLHPHPTS